MKIYQVSYFNPVLEKQCVLIKDLDLKDALQVFSSFGDKDKPFYYMGPQTRVELMPTEET
jgi:hypothetical protein